jgi:hypothetical protein
VAQTIIFTFAQDSKTITNQVGYSAYNGTASRLLWNATNANGAPYPWYGLFNLGSDGISINRGTYTDAGTGAFLHAWEIGFWYQGMGVNGSISKIFDKAWGGFSIQIQNNQISFMRASATSGNYVMWTSDRTVSPGTTLYVQVAVNIPANPRSVAANNVSIYVGQTPNKGTPVAPTKTNVTVTHTSSDTSWYNDATGANSVIANCSSGCSNYNCNMGVIIYREFYNEAPNWATYSDWSTDSARWNPAVATTISCTPSTTTPNIGQNYTVTGTLQTTGGVKLAGKSIDVWWSNDGFATGHVAYGYCTTDSNGNYSYTQTGEAAPGEWEYVAFEGDSGHHSCDSSGSVWHAVGQAVSTAITEYASTTNPTVGASFNIYGTLTSGSSKLTGKSIDLSANGSYVDTATTDSNGVYSFIIQSAVAGDTYYDVSFTATGNYLGCDDEIMVTGEEDQDTSSLTCIASTTTPNVGDIFTLSGVLEDTTTSAGFSATVTLSTGPTTTSDSNGNYSFSVTALAGTLTYYTTYAGTTTQAACSSPTVTIVAIIVVTTTVVPAMVTDVPTPTFLQYIYANPPVVPAMIATAGLNPTIQIGYTITTTVVGMEIATVIVYPDVEHMWEFCFPAVATGSELRARPLIVSQLSTQVTTEVVGDCIIETQNYTGIEESETVTTDVVPAMEIAAIDPYAKIAFQEIDYYTVTLDEELDVTSTLTDTIDLVAVVTDEIDLELEVVTE